jgi:16S rRNA (cytidine1402-2'-O)-methyltransferase
LVCLETPHRLLAALKHLLEILGDRKIAVARELTKLHEEIFRGTIAEAMKYYEDNPVKGEITLVIAGTSQRVCRWSYELVKSVVDEALAGGESPAKIARDIAVQSGWTRRELYRLITELLDKA